MRKLVGLATWGKVFEIGEHHSTRVACLLVHRLLLEMKRRQLKWRRVFLGDIRAWVVTRLVDLLGPRTVLLLDDGNVTLTVHANMELLGRNRTKAVRQMISPRAAIFDRLLAGVLGPFSPTSTDEDYGYFTCFELPSESTKQVIVRHGFENLRRLTASRETDKTEVLFFGGPLSELGVIAELEELNYLSLIKKYYERGALRPKYVAHRRDSDAKLIRIGRDLGLTIERFDAPAEVALLTRDILPVRIASFYSTALYTVSRLLALNADAFELQTTHVAARYRNDVRKVYDAYRKTLAVIPRHALS